MNIIIPISIVLSVIIVTLAIVIIKSILSPKQIAAIAENIKAGRYPNAIKIAKAILSKEPRNAAAHYYLGLAYQADGKGELALMEFKTVNQLSQFDKNVPETEFRKRVADLYLKYGQQEEALKEYLMLMKLKPNDPETYYMAGKLFQERGRMDNAVGYLRKSLEIDPRQGKAHYELGLILYREKKNIEAKNEFQESLKYEPENAGAAFYVGKILKDNHDYTPALLMLEKAARSADFKTKALVERGGCYMSLNDFDRAIPELERAVRSSKDEGSNEVLYGRYFLAMCFEKLRDLDRAIEQWELIYQKKPAFRDVAEKLSQYQEFRTDDRMKDYITSSKEEFLQICSSIVSSSMGYISRETKDIQNGVDIIVVEADNQKWLGTKKIPHLYRFLRVPEVLDESAIRKLLDDMKNQNILRGAIFTSSGFTRSAMDFAENRPLELFTKEQLQKFLDKASFFNRSSK
jgi:tetratricopeptide (TPR) repeat protein